MLGNMGLRAEMAALEERVSRLEAVTRDQEMIINRVQRLNDSLRDQIAKSPAFRIRSSDPSRIYFEAPIDEVLRLLLEHLGLDAEEVRFKSSVCLVKRQQKKEVEK